VENEEEEEDRDRDRGGGEVRNVMEIVEKIVCELFYDRYVAYISYIINHFSSILRFTFSLIYA